MILTVERKVYIILYRIIPLSLFNCSEEELKSFYVGLIPSSVSTAGKRRFVM